MVNKWSHSSETENSTANEGRKKTIKQIDELLKPRGVDRRNARYYINGKEVPASTAYQTNIEQMEVKTGADGTLKSILNQ